MGYFVKKTSSGYIYYRWITPTIDDVNNRIRAINGKNTDGSEQHFYCNQSCKTACPIYKNSQKP